MMMRMGGKASLAERMSMMSRTRETSRKVLSVLKKASKLHAAHMNGSEPTSMASQKKLMALIEEAISMVSGE